MDGKGIGPPRQWPRPRKTSVWLKKRRRQGLTTLRCFFYYHFFVVRNPRLSCLLLEISKILKYETNFLVLVPVIRWQFLHFSAMQQPRYASSHMVNIFSFFVPSIMPTDHEMLDVRQRINVFHAIFQRVKIDCYEKILSNRISHSS